MEKKYTLIIELEGEEVFSASSNTADDIFNYLRVGEKLADARQTEILEEVYQDEFSPHMSPLYETLEADNGL